MNQTLDRICILDFGSQYTQLIARRIRELGVYSEILPPDSTWEEIKKLSPKGIIFSGGPQSVHLEQISVDPHLFETQLPTLGICYGMQLLIHQSGGSVQTEKHGEYGGQQIQIHNDCPIFQGLSPSQEVWMSHRDTVRDTGPTYQKTASSKDGLIAAVQHPTELYFGLQFHPEVSHTSQGAGILSNFLNLCEVSRDWSLTSYISNQEQLIRQKVGDKQVVSLVSGGVDSTVATFLCQRALGCEKVHAIYIDTGLMREGETEQVEKSYKENGFTQLHVIRAKDHFLQALAGLSHSEEKRRAIGDTFIHVAQEAMEKLGLCDENTFLCQGTLYTDLIESGKGCGSHAEVIKSHHNVNPPIVEEKRSRGLLIEPNSEIFKDEVRDVGRLLGIPDALLNRHPFPGPGLGIRILGEVTAEAIEKLRKADRIYLEEIHQAGLYDEIWQAFAVFLPVTSVGVQGDSRTEGNVIALRAIRSLDGMTAAPYFFDGSFLQRVATRIANEVTGINRVVYDVTPKPPATVEWE